MLSDLLRFVRLGPGRPDGRRVLFVTNMWPDELRPYYGSFIASQARSLAATGITVDVIYVRGFVSVGAYVEALVRLPRLARRAPYELVHVHYGHTAAAALGIRGRPLIVSFCGEDLLGAPREGGMTNKSRLEVAVFRQIARTATVTITKSDEMERTLPVGVREHNFVLPNGVDLEAFAPRSRLQARQEVGWPPEGQVMLFLGDPADPRKNVGLARAAAEAVCRRLPNARLHIAWEESPDKVPILMNAASCLLFTSRSEGSPNAVKEAMACALPIVATPVGDVPVRLANVTNCFVCEPTVGHLAEGLMKALEADRAPEARVAVESVGLGVIARRLTEIYDIAVSMHTDAVATAARA